MNIPLKYVSNWYGHNKERVREVEINTLDDLFELVRKEGDIIIREDHDDDSFSLLVYDDYME